MIIMFFADGFEETEAIVPLDIMRRAKLEVVTVSVNRTTDVTGAHGVAFKADTTADALVTRLAGFTRVPEAVVLPGGMPGTLNLSKNPTVKEVVMRCARADAVIAAICAAPSILGSLGLLEGKRAVCYPGYEDKLTGALLSDDEVTVDGSVITARAMGASYGFGLALVAALAGEDAAKDVAAAGFIRV